MKKQLLDFVENSDNEDIDMEPLDDHELDNDVDEEDREVHILDDKMSRAIMKSKCA